jgi:hypothetical protein
MNERKGGELFVILTGVRVATWVMHGLAGWVEQGCASLKQHYKRL